MILAVLALVVAAFTAEGKARDKSHDHAAAYDTCDKACGDCQRECDSCATHCAKLIADGKKEHLKTLQTCQDCATHCSAAACIVPCMGPFSDTICTAWAEACARCGKFPDDAHMKKCADECKKCEKACRDMLKHIGGGKTAK